jgi:hypothetical protein
MDNVQEINDLDELADFRSAWHKLFCQTPRASFFLTPDWLETYWRHFGHTQKLRLLILRDGDQVSGIVPFCVRPVHYQVGTVNVLTFPLDDWGMWYRPIGPRPAESLALAMEHLYNTPRDWDFVDLRWCDAELNTTPTLNAHEYQSTSIIDLAGNWDQFLQSKPRKVRCEIRRILRRIADRPDVQYIRYRPQPGCTEIDPGWNLYEKCVQVAESSWQARLTDGNTISHPVVADYLRDAHHAASQLGMVDVNLLLVDDQPAAFLYNYIHDGRLVCLRTGFDPRLEIGGLGTALFLLSIQDSLQRNDHEFDLGPGDQRFKRHLRTRCETNYRLQYHPALSLRSQAVRVSQWLKTGWHSDSTANSAKQSA